LERLNYFNPYSPSGEGAREDDLTRALLALVRLVPSVRLLFLDHLFRAHEETAVRMETDAGCSWRLSAIAPQTFWSATQVEHLPDDVGEHLISVLLVNEDWRPTKPIEASTRRLRYDGVFHLPPRLTFFIENKLDVGDVWEEQLTPNLEAFPTNERPKLDPVPAVLTWPDILARLDDLLTVHALSGPGYRLVQDFLEFTDEQFPNLTPFDSLRRCKNSSTALRRRCLALLRDTAKCLPTGLLAETEQPQDHGAWGPYLEFNMSKVRGIRLVELRPQVQDGEFAGLELLMYPGDTMGQGRDFYKTLDKNRLMELATNALSETRGAWCVRPFPHFSFMNTHMVFPGSPLSLEQYVDRWLEDVEDGFHFMRTHTRESVDDGNAFDELWFEMVEAGLVNPSSREEFNAAFVESNRTFLYVCPTIEMTYCLDRDEALVLDEHDGIVGEELARSIMEGLRAIDPDVETVV